MKKHLLLLPAYLLVFTPGFSQTKEFKKDLTYQFYGQLRTDISYNSRLNQESDDGLFPLFPLDKITDASGADLNSVPNGDFCAFYTQLGVRVAGAKLGAARASANVEIDFRGSASSYSLARIRHAYLKLDWKRSSLLLGQTWHPLSGDVSPQLLSLSAGAPFQPYSRAPQLRYQHTVHAVRFTGAAIWQSQFASVGPESVKSTKFLKWGCLPELYAGVDYVSGPWLAGAGIELLSIKPRTESLKDRKVDERITTLSYEVHAKYENRNFFAAAKSVIGSNLTQVSMLGGYRVSSVNEETGEQKYLPMHHSSSWINVAYGKRWRPGLFFGYMKKLTKEKVVVEANGTGTDIQQLLGAGAELTYNLKHWKIGLEYMYTSADYENPVTYKGEILAIHTHTIRNHRIGGAVVFMF